MAMIVKICGLSTPDTLAAALAGGADMVGFVHFPKSPRHVSLQDARALAAQAQGRAEKALLTVDAGDDMLAAAVAAFRPDILQLHGHETPARVADVRRMFGLKVMKAVGVRTADDFSEISAFEAVADFLLFDAAVEGAATLPGGNGRVFDWALLKDRAFTRPWLLGGGLTPQNVGEAIRMTGATRVDVSTGVERARGIKDIGKIANFIAAVRAAEKLGSLAASS